MIGFIRTSVTIFLNHTQLKHYSIDFQFTVAHALGFFVFTSRLLETDLNTENGASYHYEVLLLFRLQSLSTSLS
jgi:hypothetical protein